MMTLWCMTGMGTELKHSISCDVIHIRLQSGWSETGNVGMMAGRQYKVETASNQSFLYPPRIEQNSWMKVTPPLCPTPFDSRAYQDVPWYFPPYDTISPTDPMFFIFCFAVYLLLLSHFYLSYLCRHFDLVAITLCAFVYFLSVPEG
jgi:hypothetical protein